MEIAQQMRVMRVGAQGSAVAMGFFDGVHIGHQSVIRTAVDIARAGGLKAAVFTFRLPPESICREVSLVGRTPARAPQAGFSGSSWMAAR